MTDQVIDTIKKIVKEKTGLNISKINFDKDFRSQVNLDSMQFISISAHVEKQLKINLPPSVIAVNTINEFINMVRKEVDKKK